MIENNDWLRSNIKSELFVDAFGQEEGLKVRAETDPDVIKALGPDAAGARPGRQRQESCGGTKLDSCDLSLDKSS